jgi:hypothetical protein
MKEYKEGRAHSWQQGIFALHDKCSLKCHNFQSKIFGSDEANKACFKG